MFAEMLDNFETLEASHSRKPKLHNELTPWKHEGGSYGWQGFWMFLRGLKF
jgi:hypothetical protein